jgi:hypothetical protein
MAKLKRAEMGLTGDEAVSYSRGKGGGGTAGDFLEAGVWRGGTSIAVAHHDTSPGSRYIYIYRAIA